MIYHRMLFFICCSCKAYRVQLKSAHSPLSFLWNWQESVQKFCSHSTWWGAQWRERKQTCKQVSMCVPLASYGTINWIMTTQISKIHRALGQQFVWCIQEKTHWTTTHKYWLDLKIKKRSLNITQCVTASANWHRYLIQTGTCTVQLVPISCHAQILFTIVSQNVCTSV